MRIRVPLLLCALLLCAVAVGATPAAGELEPGETHLELQLQDDGDAEWSVAVAVDITDEEEREHFETFAAQFESEERDLELGVGVFERAARKAAPESDREMEIHSVRRESEIVDGTETEEGVDSSQWGILRVTFTWESFARVDEDGTLYVDDAFETEEGTWLPGLTADQSLTIKAPPGYGGPTTSPIGADEGDLHWEGPTTFDPGYLTIVYHPTSVTQPADGYSTALVVGALVLSGAALLVGLYLLFSRRRTGDQRESSPSTDSNGRQPETAADVTEPATGETASADGETEPTVSDAPTTEAGPLSEQDIDLLSDEERVEYLLEQNGGRMKQATIVKETGWSNAKVSQLLSSMDESDRINKLRIGRENLISLPGEGVGDIEAESDEG